MKSKIEIKSVFGKVLFEYECEDNTVKTTVEEAARIGSNLSGSDLRRSDLRGSNLSGSDLSGSDLSGSITDKRYIQISCIGSRKEMTTYCFDDDKVWCGCWTGTLKEFEDRVKETHKDNPQFLKEYLGFIEYVRKVK